MKSSKTSARPNRRKGRIRSLAVFFTALTWIFAGLAAQERFRRTPPPPEPFPSLRLPNIEQATLSNGLKLAVVFREGLQLISLQLVILSGENASPPRLPGLAAAAACMFERGTMRRSASDIEGLIDAMGGSLNVTVQQDATFISYTFLEDYLDNALSLLSEIILQPAYNELDWLDVRRTMASSLQNMEEDPDFISRRLLLRRLYENSPVREPLLGAGQFRAINLRDISDFTKRHYRPNNALMVLAGNISLRTATRKVSHFLNTWEAGPSGSDRLPSPQPNSSLRVCFVDMPRAPAATICLGNIIPSISSPLHFPLQVFNQVLGGTPNSRLFLNLRESKAIAYYAFSENLLMASHGVFMVRARVTPEAVAPAISEILREIRRAMTERILPMEIEQAKSYLIGHFPLALESLDQLSMRVAALLAYRLGGDYWDRYVENTMLVSSEAVQSCAQQLPLLAPLVVVAGDQSVLLEHLRNFEKVEVYDKKGDLQYTLVKER